MTSTSSGAGSTAVVVCSSCGTKNRVPAAAAGTPRCARCKEPLGWIVDAGDEDVAEVVDRSPVPVVVDLWAPWCGPCRTVSPILEQLASRYAGRCKVVKVNVDENPATSQRFGVQSIPMLVALSGGKEVGRHLGAAPEPQLRQWMSSTLALET